jgi:hypothetical protein
MGENVRFSKDFGEAFKEAAQPAFAPDELKIGSLVFGRLRPLLGSNYNKDDDFRPLLVTGLWRCGYDIEKIEAMSFSSATPKKLYPSVFPYTLPHLKGSSRKTFLNTSSLYLLENKESLFSKRGNQAIAQVNDEIWPEILLRRVGSIVYNPSCHFYGQHYFSLMREGFVFDSIPLSAVRSQTFMPEIQMQARLSRPVNIMSQDKVNEIVSFAISYTEYMRQKNGHAYFSFPDLADWPRDIPQKSFPRWESNAPGAGGLRPQLP